MAIQSPTILIIDDEPAIINLFKRFGLKYFTEATFVGVQSPGEAIEYLNATQPATPNMVLLDIDFNGVPAGFDLLPIIAGRVRQHAPIIMLTNSNRLPDISRAFSLGATAFTEKPDVLPDWKKYIETIRSYWLNQPLT